MTGVGGVITTILIGLTAVLAVAAFCVGLMLVRRSRPKPEVGSSTPQTVGELVRKRSEPLPDDVSGKDLFTPTDGRLRAVTPAAAATADAPERGPDAAADGRSTLTELVDAALEEIRRDGLDALSHHRGHPGHLALPRAQDVAAAYHRVRR